MGFHMCSQIAGKCKFFVTQLTGMWFITYDQQMAKKKERNKKRTRSLGVCVIEKLLSLTVDVLVLNIYSLKFRWN